MFIVIKKRSELSSNKKCSFLKENRKKKNRRWCMEKSEMCVRASIGPKTINKNIKKPSLNSF